MTTRNRSVTVLVALALLTTVASAEVTVTTDKDSYLSGETVQITVQNLGPSDVEFNSAPYVQIYNTDTLECMYGCVGLPVMTPFPAGTTVYENWDTGYLPDTPGHYAVVVNILGPTISTSYTLTSEVGLEPISWGTVKALYKERPPLGQLR